MFGQAVGCQHYPDLEIDSHPENRLKYNFPLYFLNDIYPNLKLFDFPEFNPGPEVDWGLKAVLEADSGVEAVLEDPGLDVGLEPALAAVAGSFLGLAAGLKADPALAVGLEAGLVLAVGLEAFLEVGLDFEAVLEVVRGLEVGLEADPDLVADLDLAAVSEVESDCRAPIFSFKS